MEPHKLTSRLTLFGGSTGQSPDAGRTEPVSPAALNQNQPEPSEAETKNTPLLPVAVRDLVPLLVDAFQTDRTWLKDFGREEIHVSADLYEILLAYQQFRRYDAA